MTHGDPRSVLRLAIALTALKYKPRDQSFASYLLDLQSHFPLATEHNESRDWRTYALELEEQLAALKAQRDADQELLSKLPIDASRTASISDAPPPKKKSKKDPTKDQHHDPERSWDQSRADWSRFLSSQYPSSPSLVAVYASLKGALAAPNTDLLSYTSRLSDAVLRALDAVHLFLFSPSNPSPDSHAQTTFGTSSQLMPEHIDSARIALASPLVAYVLQTALHTLVRTAEERTKPKRPRQRPHTATHASIDAHAHVDKVLDRLLERILLPLLRALAPLCSARLAHLLSTPLRKDKVGRGAGRGKDKDKDKDKRTSSASVDPPKNPDVRTDVFALIGTSLGALDTLPPLARPPGPGTSAGGGGAGSIASGVRDRLGLEAIRELEVLYAVSPPSATVPPPSSFQPSSQQPPATPSEPPLPIPNPTLLSVPSVSQPRPQPQTRAQRRAVTESRAKRLERLAGTRVERVRALATRDAGWFLVSTLNLCVTPPAGLGCHGAPAATGSLGQVLREALLDRIGNLVRSVPFDGPPFSVLDSEGQQPSDLSDADSKFTIDPVCQNMLLAICERAMGYLVS